MSKAAIMVGFRLDPQHHKLLEAVAERAGESPGEAARRMVIQALNHPEDLSRIEEKLSELRGDVGDLRTDFAIAAQALLTFGGKTSEADAKSWVSANLKPK